MAVAVAVAVVEGEREREREGEKGGGGAECVGDVRGRRERRRGRMGEREEG